MTPSNDDNRQADVELFDLENQGGEKLPEEEILLNPQAVVIEELDVTSQNLHMGSTDQRQAEEGLGHDSSGFKPIAEPGLLESIHVYNVSISSTVAEQAAAEGAQTVEIDIPLGDIGADDADAPGNSEGNRQDGGAGLNRGAARADGAQRGDDDAGQAASGDVQVRIVEIPEGVEINVGTVLDDGSVSLTLEELEQLEVTVPEDQEGQVDFRVVVDEEPDDRLTIDDILPQLPPIVVDNSASDPRLRAKDAFGEEDEAIALDIRSSLTDRDGSETLEIVVEGVPDGAVLSAGTDNGDGSWSLERGDLKDLTITPPANSDADFKLNVRAIATESNGGATSERNLTIKVGVEAEADDVRLQGSDAAGGEDEAIALDIQAALTDTDGSERLSIVISNVPEGAELSAGSDGGNGTWTLEPGDLEGLTITPPANSDADFRLDVEAVSREANGDEARQSLSINVGLEAEADEAELSISNAAGQEDNAIDLDIRASLTDTDGSETLSVTLDGLPDGASLSAGTENDDGSWTLEPDQLEGLQLVPADDFSGTFNLSVTATTTEQGGDTATVTRNLQVQVDEVVDAAELSVAAGSPTYNTRTDVEIDNPSFESSDLDNGRWNSTVDGWDLHGQGGTWDPSTQFTDPNGASDGENVVHLNSGSIAQTTDQAFTPGGSFELQVDIGNRLDNRDATYEVKLYAGDEEIGSISSDELPVVDGEFVTATISVDGSDFAEDFAGFGEDIRIEIAKTGGGQLNIDNVRMTAEGSDIGGNVTEAEVPLTIEAAAEDGDTVSFTVDNLPDGATLSAGTENEDGSWSLTSDEVAGLKVIVPAGSEDLELNVTATTTGESGEQATSSQTIEVGFDRTASTPDVSVSLGEPTITASESIEIENASFEAPALDNGRWNSTVDGWELDGQGGTWDPSTQFKDADGASDGENVVHLNRGTISQTLEDTFNPSQDYDLNVDIGNRLDQGDATYEIKLYAGDQEIGSISSDDLPVVDGEFVTATVSVDGGTFGGDFAGAGQPIRIEIAKTGGGQLNIDNVRLETEAESANTENATVEFPLNIDVTQPDADGSERLSVTVSGVPEGAELSAGTDNGDGSWTLESGDLEGLTITTPGNATDFNLSVEATSTETFSGASASDTAGVTVDVPDLPEPGAEVEQLNEIQGTNNAETLNGTSASDDIDAKSGNDDVRAGDGNDQVAGGAGKDKLYGQDGNDTLDGGKDDDKLYGGNGNDTLAGGSGRDELDGGAGDDTFIHQRGQDTDDVLKGGSGDDTLVSKDDGDFLLNRFASNNSIENVDGGDTESNIIGTTGDNSLDFRNTNFENIGYVDASGGNDTVRGTQSGDDIRGGTGKDKLYGEGGDDILNGGNHDDRLYGGAGDDTLIGGTGRDELDGGAGDDTFLLDGHNDANDVLKGGSGNDTVMESNDDRDLVFNRFASNNSIETVSGGESENAVTGTNGDNSLDFRNTSFENISHIDAGGGNDTVRGTQSGDDIRGGSGKDKLYGEGGNDTLDGGSQDDKLYGGAGDDTLTGGSGRDELDGGSGNDTFVLDGAQDNRDILRGGDGTDRIIDKDGGDIELRSFASNNSVEIVDGGDEASAVVGTNSDDNLDFRNAEFNNITHVDAGAGNDTVRGTRNDDDIRGGSGKDKLYGEAGNDVLDGGSKDDKLYGGAGDDTLIGGSGRDELDGGDGNDTFVLDGADDNRDILRGGAGTDRIIDADGGDIELRSFSSNNSVEVVDGGDEASAVVGTNSNDSLDFRNAEFNNITHVDAGAGNDTVRGTQNADDIRGGSGKDKLYGEGGDDTLDGGSSDDKLYGGAGNDTLIGGSGRDQLDGGDGDDTFVFNDDDGRDILVGGAGDDTLVDGDGGDLHLNSFSSNNSIETISGGEEETNIVGTNGNNTFDFRNTNFDNIGQVDAGAGNDTVRGTSGGDDILGGSGHDKLYGEGGDDVLSGGSGNDKLYGGDGDDTLTGGSGRDEAWGDAGDDMFIFGSGQGSNTFHGGDGGGWLDSVKLQNGDGSGADPESWTMELNSGSIEEQADGYLALSQDSSGTITFDDGSTLNFDGVERIEW
ncbi:MAG: beta strand repeat-containing protein [Magnetovibrionaceae bacterium]